MSWRELDGEWLVYDASTGTVHCMGPLVAAVLDQIQGGVGDLQALRDWVLQCGVPVALTDLEQAVAQALSELSRAELIEAIPA